MVKVQTRELRHTRQPPLSSPLRMLVISPVSTARSFGTEQRSAHIPATSGLDHHQHTQQEDHLFKKTPLILLNYSITQPFRCNQSRSERFGVESELFTVVV